MARKRVVLGVTGGIASYKSVWLARQLTESGMEVDVVMTSAAQEFVGGITFEAVTGRSVYTEIFGIGNALDHIRLGREADAILIAPATADFIARAAQGQANDLLSAILLAATCPVVLAPAMNDKMWAHPQTGINVAHLIDKLGYYVIPPDTGPLAVGEGIGPGRLPEPEMIRAHLGRAMEPPGPLNGRHVVVSAGATREKIDPVRFISNHSSGKTGAAIAAAAWRRGAEVTVIAGHTDVPMPFSARVIRVESTIDMQRAVQEVLPSADVLVMAAAPADFAPADVADKKIKKKGQGMSLDMVENPDILKTTVSARKKGSIMVGFALETDTPIDFAKDKLRDKELDLIVANQAGLVDSGFGSDTNRVSFIDRSGRQVGLPLMSKGDVAEELLTRIEDLISGR